jgi:hypothetical protein
LKRDDIMRRKEDFDYLGFTAGLGWFYRERTGERRIIRIWKDITEVYVGGEEFDPSVWITRE